MNHAFTICLCKRFATRELIFFNFFAKLMIVQFLIGAHSNEILYLFTTAETDSFENELDF